MASGDLGFGTTMKFRFLTFLFISWLLSISLQAEKGDVPITATDTSSDAGTRESTKKLKMVYKGEERTAKLKIPSGNYQQNEPKWSGNGVNGSPGSLTATFEGSSSTMAMIHSDDPPRDGEVNIELVPEDPKEDPVPIEGVIGAKGEWFKNGFAQIGLGVEVGSTPGDFKLEQKWADKYDNPDVAVNKRLYGSGEFHFTITGSIAKSFEPFGIEIQTEIKSEGSVQSQVKVVNYMKEWDKPPGPLLTGYGTVSGQGGTTFTLSATIPVNSSNIVSITVSGQANMMIGIQGQLEAVSGKFTVTASAITPSLIASCSAKTLYDEIQFANIELPLPTINIPVFTYYTKVVKDN